MKHINIFLQIFIISLFILNCTGSQSAFAQDNLKYCNAVQNNFGLIRYPLGTIAVSSSGVAEMSDAITLAPRIYPSVNAVAVRKANEDWNSQISGDPSKLFIQYNEDKPSGASMAEITVTPHVSVFKVTFPAGANDKFLVFDFSNFRVDNWAELYKWTERKVTRIDDRTFEATIGEPGKVGVYYTIKFSEPIIGSGTIDSEGKTIDGVGTITGKKIGMFAKINSSTITVALSQAFTSMAQSKEFLSSEFTDFDSAWKKCNEAWNIILNRVEIEATNNNKRMAYTALYTLLVNTINGDEGSCYLNNYQHPKVIASSLYWQFIGGFQSCCWDNYRTAYPFMMLGYPDVMLDVVNTYLARYQRNEMFTGNTCLFTGPTGGHIGVRFTPVLIAEALANCIPVDYSKYYAGLKDNYDNPKYVPSTLKDLGYATQPATGGTACSQTLEWSTSFYALAQLANANKDLKSRDEYLKLSKSYKNIWDSENLIFRVKNEDGSWGAMVKKSGLDSKNWTWNPNPQGLFEGTSTDWMFSVPHDPYGLINLPEQKDFVERIASYCAKDTWFNDYQYHYPYLLYYAGAPNRAQEILRNIWIPMFKNAVIYEGVSPNPNYKPWKTHYTSDAGWLISSMIGLFPVPSPSGQLIITSPAITKAVIHHGDKTITIQTHNNSDKNIYVASIKINGKIYPSYLIPSRLAVGVKIDLEMSNDSTVRLGDLYISSSDGYIESAEMLTDSHLRCKIEAAVKSATTKFYSTKKPNKILINGTQIDNINYDQKEGITTIQNDDAAIIDVIIK